METKLFELSEEIKQSIRDLDALSEKIYRYVLNELYDSDTRVQKLSDELENEKDKKLRKELSDNLEIEKNNEYYLGSLYDKLQDMWINCDLKIINDIQKKWNRKEI